MKGKILSLNIRYAVYAVSLILSIVATYFLFPQTDDFSHYFEIGKPWTYEALMAPKDFAVYKSDAALESERAEAMKGLEPYVTQDINHRLQIVGVSNTRMSDWLRERLNEVYAVGVIALQDKQEFEALGVEKVVVLEGNVVKEKVLFASVLFSAFSTSSI